MNLRAALSQSFSPIRPLIHSPVIKNFFIYSFGSLCLRTISLILIPLNMRKFMPSDYGTLSLITSFISIATAIMGLGLRQVLSIEYFHATEQHKKILINDIIAIYCACAIPILAIALSYNALIIEYVFLDAITSHLLIIALLIVFISFFAELLYQVMQYEQLAFALTLLQVTISLIIASCTLLFVWQYEWGISGIITSQFIGSLIGAVAAIFAYRWYNYHTHRSPFHSIPSKAPDYLITGFPFIPAIIFSWALSGANRWMLAYYGTMHDVGIYAIADLGSQVFYAMILQPWGGSYLPYIMSRYTHNKNNIAEVESENQKTMYLSMIGLGGLILIGAIVCHPILLRLFPHDYHEAIGHMWILLLGQVFLLGGYFASALLQFQRKTYFITISMIVPILFQIVINRFLIPHFRINGCVLAVLISYIIYFAGILLYKKNTPIK